MVGMRHGDWVEKLIEEMNDAMTTTVSFTDTAAERERALQAEVERLRGRVRELQSFANALIDRLPQDGDAGNIVEALLTSGAGYEVLDPEPQETE